VTLCSVGAASAARRESAPWRPENVSGCSDRHHTPARMALEWHPLVPWKAPEPPGCSRRAYILYNRIRAEANLGAMFSPGAATVLSGRGKRRPRPYRNPCPAPRTGCFRQPGGPVRGPWVFVPTRQVGPRKAQKRRVSALQAEGGPGEQAAGTSTDLSRGPSRVSLPPTRRHAPHDIALAPAHKIAVTFTDTGPAIAGGAFQLLTEAEAKALAPEEILPLNQNRRPPAAQ